MKIETLQWPPARPSTESTRTGAEIFRASVTAALMRGCDLHRQTMTLTLRGEAV